MPEGIEVLLLIVSAIILMFMAIKATATRYLKIPPTVLYILLGLLVRLASAQWPLLSKEATWTLEFLGQLGVGMLLFRVGLQSDLRGLVEQLPRAVPTWLGDVLVSSGAGFLAGWLLGLGLVPSMFIAAALSATSVGISVQVWQEAGRLRSKLGHVLVDVAELDDLSAVVMMLLVVSVAPSLHDGGQGMELAKLVGGVLLEIGLKVLVFAALCWAFAHWVEARFTRWVARAEGRRERILSIAAVGLGLGAVAGMLGFSVAVGALFAGLIFSRDKRAVREEVHFESLYLFFSPFFFFDVGLALDPAVIGPSALLGAALFLAAGLGKVVGTSIPLRGSEGWRGALIFGVSMIPRAEIALVVARAGLELGPWALSDTTYGALVCASGLTAIVSPVLLQRLFVRWPQVAADEHDDDKARPGRARRRGR